MTAHAPGLTRTRLTVAAPDDFAFWPTVISHGWCALPPFECNRRARTLARTFDLGDIAVHAIARAAHGSIALHVRSQAPLTAGQRAALRRQIRSCFRLDEDFAAFHRFARRHPEFRWIARMRSGRMLRAPTAFEDAVKMICTTNCTWGLTTIMVTRLVEVFGARTDGFPPAFPRADAIAASTERTLRARCSMGYRAPYILELARRVASGTIDVESWRASTLPTEELVRSMRSVKGVGPYAADNLLKLAGRYDRLGLDSWVRGQFAVLRGRGRRVSDATIERAYGPLGRWRGLLFWLEMTRGWHDEKFPVGGGDGA